MPEDCSANLNSETRVLGIESSQRAGGVALRDNERVIQVEMLSQEKRHDDDLLPAIERLCSRIQLAPQEISAVGVSIGPGGFTGLRIAISTAKMLAETLKVKLLAVPTAQVVAESLDGDGPILVALASKQDTAWCAQLERFGNEWKITKQLGIIKSDVFNLTGIKAVVADEYLPKSMREKCEESSVVIREPEFSPRSCLIVAERMFVRGEVTDPLEILPIYPRPPEAVSLWEKRKKKNITDYRGE